jgi:hypothetical protein
MEGRQRGKRVLVVTRGLGVLRAWPRVRLHPHALTSSGPQRACIQRLTFRRLMVKTSCLYQVHVASFWAGIQLSSLV